MEPQVKQPREYANTAPEQTLKYSYPISQKCDRCDVTFKKHHYICGARDLYVETESAHDPPPILHSWSPHGFQVNAGITGTPAHFPCPLCWHHCPVELIGACPRLCPQDLEGIWQVINMSWLPLWAVTVHGDTSVMGNTMAQRRCSNSGDAKEGFLKESSGWHG